MAVNAFLRQFPNSNPQPLLPLNKLHSSDTMPGVRSSLASNAHSPTNMASMTEERQDTLTSFSRQEIHLQKTLQDLLDAQSEGLQSGLGMPPNEDDTSTGGPDTPAPGSYNGSSQRAKGVIPVRQSTRKKIGLRSARRGISRAMNDLAALKIREEEVMEAQLADTEEDLVVVQGLTNKKKGLEEQILNIENEETGQNIEQLKQEEQALDAEIKALENTLWEMKSRQRHLLGQIESLDNSMQSKLSSYKAALTLAEKEATAFLARPKVVTSIAQGVSESLWVLPVPRRTLEMASEYFYEERERLRQRSHDIEVERNALQEGVVMWEDVVAEITAVEQTLQEEMQRLPADQPSKRSVENGSMDGMQIVLRRLEGAKLRIESQLTLAEERRWKLLVCCIGAELEAILAGYEMLQNVAGASQSSGMAKGTNIDRERANDEGRLIDEIGPDLSNASKTQVIAGGCPRIMDRSEDEDDEPGPELLISHMEDE